MAEQQLINKVYLLPQQPPKKIEEQQKGDICQHYVVRKKRQCKFQVTKGSKYCAAHCIDLQDKIQCPYEKGFYISSSKYEKHLKNCPKLRNVKKEENSGWFSKDINKVDENEEMEKKEEAQVFTLHEVDEMIIDKIVKKIIEIYLKWFQEKDRIHFIESSEKQVLQNTTNDHLQAIKITQKAFQNQLISPEFIYVQFGAGKGILSFAIAETIQSKFSKHSKNILLQRESRRNKFDKYFRDNPYFQRYKGDVSNFDFTVLPKTMAKTAIEKCHLKVEQQLIEKQVGKCELIGVCKHMCGEALDISMRGLIKGNCKGCILASCCHHLCRYNTYLNPSFFEKEGLTPEQIQILFKISSWGTKSHLFPSLSPSIFSNLHQTPYIELHPDERILIGRMSKRLIDTGRAEYLEGKLYRYCSDQITPENYVIISRN